MLGRTARRSITSDASPSFATCTGITYAAADCARAHGQLRCPDAVRRPSSERAMHAARWSREIASMRSVTDLDPRQRRRGVGQRDRRRRLLSTCDHRAVRRQRRQARSSDIDCAGSLDAGHALRGLDIRSPREVARDHRASCGDRAGQRHADADLRSGRRRRVRPAQVAIADEQRQAAAACRKQRHRRVPRRPEPSDHGLGRRSTMSCSSGDARAAGGGDGAAPSTAN